MKVLVTRAIPEPGVRLLSEALDVYQPNPFDKSMTKGDLLKAVGDVDAIYCLLTDHIDAEVLEAACKCRLVANMAVGYNNIDVAAATRLGIGVTNTPGVLTEATADLTWALILGVARRVAEGDVEMRAGQFQGWGPLYFLGGDVSGRTLGLVGPGRIAEAVAERARGFRMTLLYHGRRANPRMEEMGARQASLDDLLRQSDFVSIHTPLTAETKHLIDSRALSLMKPTAYLINTSRGPVVDEAALVKALESKAIAGAGLDVYEAEPLMAPGLASCPNALLLPHLGSATHDTRSAMARIAAENVAAFARGDVPPNLLNSEAFARPVSRANP